LPSLIVRAPQHYIAHILRRQDDLRALHVEGWICVTPSVERAGVHTPGPTRLEGTHTARPTIDEEHYVV